MARLWPCEDELRAAVVPTPQFGWNACPKVHNGWGYWVYHLISHGGSYLYVGMTHVLEYRLRDHRRTKPWWQYVDKVAADRHCCREHAKIEEAFWIRDCNPLCNITRVGAWRSQFIGHDPRGTMLGTMRLDPVAGRILPLRGGVS